MERQAVLLSAGPLSKSYNGVAALDRATLEARAGEVHALMGENGAGKSTLIKILAGVVAADSGTIRIEGREISIATPVDAEKAGLRFVHQELNVVPQLSVAENLFLGRSYPQRLGFLVDWKDMNAQASQALALLGILHIKPGTLMGRLATGDRMLVKIAAAFMAQTGAAPKIYVMDEPTSALSGEETERLFAVIDRLRSSGCGILYVSHRMDEVLEICDRVTILRDGATVATRDIQSTSRKDLIELMTGRTIADAYPGRTSAIGQKTTLSVENFGNGAIGGISFDLREGEILGIAGVAGSGQGALLRQLMGAEGKSAEFKFSGRDISVPSPSVAWKSGLGFIPRERRVEGLVLSHSVNDNTMLPHLDRINRLYFFADRKTEKRQAAELARRVRLKAVGVDQPVRQLSGGNQQKVMFARAVAGNPRVLLLDEPTRGVDVGAKHDIYGLLRDLSAGGVAMLIASSDLPELISLTDRILVLKDGRPVAIVETSGLTQQNLLSLCYGDGNNVRTLES